jgi:hypothetical protein
VVHATSANLLDKSFQPSLLLATRVAGGRARRVTAGRRVSGTTGAVVVVAATVRVRVVVRAVAVAVVVRVGVYRTAAVVTGAVMVARAVGAGALVLVTRHDDGG